MKMDSSNMSEVIVRNGQLDKNEKERKIDTLNIPLKCKQTLLHKFHASTLKEVLLINTSRLKKVMPDYNDFRRDLFYKENLLLHDDLKKFENYNIDLNIALIPIVSLSIPKIIIRKLVNTNEYFFIGDVITADYEELAKIKGLGNKHLEELKKYVHQLGYKIKNEKETLEETKQRLHNEGIRTLDQDYEIGFQILEILFENEIYTKEDLLNIGIGVFYIPGMNSTFRGRLLETIHKNNIKLDNSLTSDDMDTANKKAIRQFGNINNKIKKRIYEKETLLKQIKKLNEEKERLLKEEALIDSKLTDIINGIRDKYEIGEKNHGRK